MKNNSYKTDNEETYIDFKKILKTVQKTINNSGGNLEYEGESIKSLLNSKEFLTDLEIICTHKNQALNQFNSNRKLNFGFSKYNNVNSQIRPLIYFMTLKKLKMI